MAFGYRYKLERQENGRSQLRFPEIPEALAEGKTVEAAFASALSGIIAALHGYMRAGRALPPGDYTGDRIVLPSLVTAKLAVYVSMREHGWSRSMLASSLRIAETSVDQLLDLHKDSCRRLIDESLGIMHRKFAI
jgi:antitoxin HicB